MADKAARQARLEKANKFLAYFDKVGYYYFSYPDSGVECSKITLVPIGTDGRQGCWLCDGDDGERWRILQSSRKLGREIGERAKLIVVALSNWVMQGGLINRRFAPWGNMPDMVKKSVELGIVK